MVTKKESHKINPAALDKAIAKHATPALQNEINVRINAGHAQLEAFILTWQASKKENWGWLLRLCNVIADEAQS